MKIFFWKKNNRVCFLMFYGLGFDSKCVKAFIDKDFDIFSIVYFTWSGNRFSAYLWLPDDIPPENFFFQMDSKLSKLRLRWVKISNQIEYEANKKNTRVREEKLTVFFPLLLFVACVISQHLW